MLSGQAGIPMSISWELFETHFERRQQCSIGMTGAFQKRRTVAGEKKTSWGPWGMGYHNSRMDGWMIGM